MWESLSMSERAEIIASAVKEGIRDLDSIRNLYNEQSDHNKYAIGGYLEWKNAANKHKGLRIDEDRTYDYKGWYNENPERAWEFLNKDSRTHFDDKYKTVYHPTFSTQSIYSGLKHPKYNPQGLKGGTWNDDHTFIMSKDGYNGPVSMDERINYLIDAEDNGVILRELDGSLPAMSDNTLLGGVLPSVTINANNYRNGGKIHIKKSKRGTFTAAAKKHGKTVQAFASQVLANPNNYSAAMRKKANFARNASKWHH